MENLIRTLSFCPLFHGLPKQNIQSMLQSIPYTIVRYNKGQIVALEGEPCDSLGIIMKGSVDIKRIFASGKEITITTMISGNIFGEVLVFSDTNLYPSTIIAVKEVEILYIAKPAILSLSKTDMQFLNNIMKLLANKVLMFNEKITCLSLQSIRQKIANYLLDYSKKQNSHSLILPYTRKEMAELMGIPRPSLSREMIKMRQEGLISFDKSLVRILNSTALEDILLY